MEKHIKYLKPLLDNKEIRDFILENNLDQEFLLPQLPYLMIFNEESKKCSECLGKNKCSQDLENSKPYLELYNNKVVVKYRRCPYKNLIDDRYCEFLFATDVEKILNMDLTINKERASILNYISDFFESYSKGVTKKGLYICGKFGVGKTFIMLHLVKLFTELKKKVVFTYYPDFIRKAKSSLSNSTLEDMVTKLKSCDVLFLDDFGAEVNTSFIRDEVLGPILEYRSQNKLPVFITSNYNIQELHQHFTETRTDVNSINSSRIIERIRLLCEVYELKDQNYRK